MSLRRGSKVWVEDRDFAWSAAEVVDYVGKQAQVVTASGKKVENLRQSLCFQINCCLVPKTFVLFIFIFLNFGTWGMGFVGSGVSGEAISEGRRRGRPWRSGRHDEIDVFERAGSSL